MGIQGFSIFQGSTRLSGKPKEMQQSPMISGDRSWQAHQEGKVIYTTLCEPFNAEFIAAITTTPLSIIGALALLSLHHFNIAREASKAMEKGCDGDVGRIANSR
eukprot:TRINITY_DN23499_c0_g1_i5.p1 TRINITY_DN23499_c0_g1~~TRINITY_DN23499_c0_g1_i5.p1  ORF type:complete len:104 (-),score=18.82 TRINITY_DN23499_c0_g1_i5:2-313(-)